MSRLDARVRTSQYTPEPMLAAEILDHPLGFGPRLAERDPSVFPKKKLFAPQKDFRASFGGDVCAVRAAVGQDELVLAPLDGAVMS